MIAECKRILEYINSAVLISENATGKLVYMNQAAQELLGIDKEEDYLGRDCDELLETRGVIPDKDATVDTADKQAERGQALIKESGVHVDTIGMTFSDSGKQYRLVISEDSRDAIRQKEELDQLVENEVIVTEALTLAMAQEEPNDAINSLLAKLGDGFEADRSYIFEVNENGGFDNTYEWCREGVTPEIDNLQNLAEHFIDPWNRAFDREGYLFIRDLEDYKSIDPDGYAILKPQEIHSLVAAPLVTITNKRVGFYGVDNPDIKKLENNEAILSVLGHFISSLIVHRKVIEQLKYVSERDDLTKAYNRTSARRLFDSIDDNETFTMFLLDIDHFKDFNEIYGARFGDRVLQQIADDLAEYLKDFPAFLARYGSDEFLVVVRGEKIAVDDPFVVNLKKAVQTPMEIGSANVIPTVSIGITYSDSNFSTQEKVAEATRAVREAKRMGRASAVVFTEEMRQEMVDEVEVKLLVRDAIENDGFYMLYQPKVSVDTLEVTGYEALVRMKDSRISPAVFIPIALENG